MLRLLGILSVDRLLFSGHRHHLCRGLLLGALLGYLTNRDLNADHAAVNVHKAVREAKKTTRDAVKAAKREIRKAEHDRKLAEIHGKIKAGKAEREEHLRAIRNGIEARKAARKEETRALPVSGINEAKVIRELAEDLERDASTAAMAADVPTIDFPDEDGKYYSSGKYGYAQ